VTGTALSAPLYSLKSATLKSQAGGSMAAFSSCSSLFELGEKLSSQESEKRENKKRQWLQNFPGAQMLSNYLLVALQYFGLGPGVLLLSFLLLQEILVDVRDQCSIAHNDWAPVEFVLPGVGLSTKHFIVRLISFFLISTGADLFRSR
jgi:hypothetical protein